MGDIHRGLSEAVNRFFVQWHAMLCNLFEEAKALGGLKRDTDHNALSRLIMSALEGAILICKASKDPASLSKTAETLKSVISLYRT